MWNISIKAWSKCQFFGPQFLTLQKAISKKWLQVAYTRYWANVFISIGWKSEKILRSCPVCFFTILGPPANPKCKGGYFFKRNSPYFGIFLHKAPITSCVPKQNIKAPTAAHTNKELQRWPSSQSLCFLNAKKTKINWYFRIFRISGRQI